MNRLRALAATVRARLVTDWQWLQTQFDKLDTTAPGAAARLKALEARREGMVEQLDLVDAVDALPEPARRVPYAAFDVLLSVSDFSEVPPATKPQALLMSRIAKWQAHANAVAARHPNGLPTLPPDWEAPLLDKRPRNPKAA